MAQEHDVNFTIRAKNAAKQAFDDVKRSLNEVESASNKLRGVLGTLGVGLSAAGFVTFIKQGIDAAASLDDLAEKTGASVEELSKLQQVARISGTDLGVVESFLIKLNKALHGTDEEAKKAHEAIKLIGLDAKELRSVDPAEAMRQVAVAFSQFADSGGKGAAIMRITGKSAAEALPFLKDLASETGIISRKSAEQAAAAEELQKSFRGLTNAATEAAQGFALHLVPGLQAVIDQFNEGRRIAGGFLDAIVLFGTINPFKSVGGNLKSIGQTIDELRGKRSQFIAQGRTGWLPQIDAEIERSKKQIEFLKFMQREEALTLGKAAGRGRLDAKDLGPQVLPKLPEFPEEKKDKRFETALEQLEQEALKVQDLTRFEEVLADIERGRYGKLNEAQRTTLTNLAAQIDLNREDVKTQKEAQEAIDRFNQNVAALAKAEDDRLNALKAQFVDLIDPIEKYRKKLEEIRELTEKGLLTPDQSAAAEFAINDLIEAAQGLNKELKETEGIGKDLGLIFKSMFEDAVVEGKKLRDVVQGLVQDLARLVLRRGVTEPLAEVGTQAIGKSSIQDLIKDLLGFGGSRAVGGPVSAGRLHLVGEQGPELFVSDTSGRIIPNNALGGGVTININNPSNADQIMQAVPVVRALIRGELSNQLRPGGALS